MFQDKYVFAQLTAFLNRTQFNNYVRKYDGNRYVKHFTCWNQLLAKMQDKYIFCCIFTVIFLNNQSFHDFFSLLILAPSLDVDILELDGAECIDECTHNST